MRLIGFLSCALLAGVALAGGPASANTCQAGNLTCPTGMPIEGYCQCTAHGVTHGGTVVRVSRPNAYHNAYHPTRVLDCRATPQAAGCPHP